ncbi:deoxyribodipyrimidine photo-lyase [uncultured Vagococcus sp.]|uniref:cryptochrome/photolyase family protein n=1 Tax=uncultured Vagococcus sp. TaxID=189676 RepID=UPI0028D1581D|nr:deoxyribodipyrimidine photo-lyase [uncultured Vagococcus sp.]
MIKTVVMWFRKDLRLEDNTAFLKALAELKTDEQLLCLFQLNPEQFKVGTKNHDYFFSALVNFEKVAKEHGFPLHFMAGEPLASFQALKQAYPDWQKIYLNRDSRGKGQVRDEVMTSYFRSQEIEIVATQDSHLHGESSVLKKDGSYYKVFTPYYRQWRQLPKRPVAKLTDFSGKVVAETEKFEAGQRVFQEVVAGITLFESVGEQRAEDRLNEFVMEEMSRYDRQRDIPAIKGTSRLSPYLRTGELSIRKVWQVATAMPESDGQQTFLKELAWRDFYHMIYSQNPQQNTQELKEHYRHLPWRRDGQLFQRWAEGQTGYPIIDAAMHQLNQTGWMHNRLRMLVASFLTKDLLVDWRLGEAYFAEQLIDYDPASNIGGWQWAASTGTDAVPYFRIFNPTSQSEKFDPDGAFIRRYLPVLKEVPKAWIHAPHLMPHEIQEKLGVVVGKDYPQPMVDHQEARKLVLAFFKQ